MQKLKIKPETTDIHYMNEVLKMAFNARIGMVLMTVVVLFLIFLVQSLLSRPLQMVVIDRNTGQAYAPIGIERELTQEILDRQLVFYATQVVENYFNFDHNAIQRARQSVYELAGGQFRGTLGADFTDNAEVKQCIADKLESYIQWEMHPRITQRNNPYYTLFMTFQRVVKDGNLTREVKKFNVRVDWGLLNKNVDYVKRPHALVLLNIKILNEGSGELNEQINRIK